MDEIGHSIAPFYSTFALFAEFVISAIIYYTIYLGYKKNIFHVKLVTFTLLYEIIFNISYMISRVSPDTKAGKVESSALISLAITHGILSLIMFIALIVFFVVAWKRYRQNVNYFKVHKNLTITFLIFWTLAVLSGALFYFMQYVI